MLIFPEINPPDFDFAAKVGSRRRDMLCRNLFTSILYLHTYVCGYNLTTISIAQFDFQDCKKLHLKSKNELTDRINRALRPEKGTAHICLSAWAPLIQSY